MDCHLTLIGGALFLLRSHEIKKQERKLFKEREITARLRRVDKLKDQFLANNTSHELRTHSLHGIIGISEGLYDGVAGNLTADAKENLSMIVSSAKRLESLVNDLLDFGRLKQEDLQLQLKNINLKSIVEIVLRISRPLLGNKQIEIGHEISDDISEINGDDKPITTGISQSNWKCNKIYHSGSDHGCCK